MSTSSASADNDTRDSTTTAPNETAPKSHETKSYPHWHDIVAGASAGLGARCLTAPLDLIKIRRQLQSSSQYATSQNTSMISSTNSYINREWKLFQHLYSIAEREGGIKSLFRGNVAASYLWMGYSVVQFWVYGYSSEHLKQYYKHLCKNSNTYEYQISELRVTGIISFTSGAIAGICGTLVTYPFDLCRTIFAARGIYPIAASNVTWSKHTTRLASESHRQYAERKAPRTLGEFSKQLYQQKGIQGFFAGSGPAILSIIPYMGLNFALHDMLISSSQDSSLQKDNHGSLLSGVAGMGAGAISKFLVYPLDTVKKRLQAQAFWGSNKNETRNTNYVSVLSDKSCRKKLVGAVNVGTKKKQMTQIVYKGMIDCFRQVLKREGAVAFYKGLVPSLLKSSVSTGASFWLFTFTKNVLQSLQDSAQN